MLRTAFKLACWTVGLGVTVLLGLAGYGYWRVASFDTTTLPERHGKLDVELFAREGHDQPLVVGFGGAEGGNAWASDHWRVQRERFLDQGYAFLAVGYFGAPGTPGSLDRISLDAIHTAIRAAAADPRVSDTCIAALGGSKGAELALSLASRYEDIDAVVGIVPSNVVFAAHTDAMTTSSFTDRGEALPFVPVPWSATPALLSGDFREAYSIMLRDTAAALAASIPVERIAGPVLLISATRDEMWPSREMADRIVARLHEHGFAHAVEHIPVEGGHAAPLQRFDAVEKFLDQHLLRACATSTAAAVASTEGGADAQD
jgi:dienelactone hydrolase